MLTISLLGPVEVRRDDRVLPVPAGKTSEVLVRLALEAGSLVSAERLVDDLWGAGAVASTRNTLQSKIVKLRRALGDPAVIVSRDGGYALDASAVDIDAHAVFAAVAATTEQATPGRAVTVDDAGVVERCDAALRRFGGELLIGAGDGEWVHPQRARLEAARLHLIEAGCAARLRLGELAAATHVLEVAVVSFPYHERLWELLVTALYRAGRQADALAAYQRARTLLADDLGLEPGPGLRAVEQQVLLQDPALTGDAGHRAHDDAVGLGNLPTMATELVGRADELAHLREVLGTHRLVELVGPGGIGKTALAIAAARTVVALGGVWLARLETTTTADEIVDAVLAAVGVTGGLAVMHERLKAAETLIVLDNCEHVLDAVADLAQLLLDAAPRTRLLCTSQVPLDLDGEMIVELAPLDLAASVELFTRRAAPPRGGRSDERGADDASDDGTRAVRDVCRALDGLPLAIELAAARTKTLSIAEIGRRLDDRIDDRLDLLADPTSRRPERRRALRATIRWSYELLFTDDQRGLWAIATFAGGATLPAVEHVLEALDVPPRTAIDVVGRLAGRSLLVVEPDTGDGPDETRYRLLDSIRAFALDEMAAAGCTEAAREAHAAWFASIARTSTDGVRGGDQAVRLAVARAERANIDAALSWCNVHDPQLAVTIAIGFGWAWVVLGDSRGAQRILAALDAGGAAVPRRERATGLLLVGWIEASLGDLDRARAHVADATALAEATEDGMADADLQARAAYYLAYVVSHEGDFRRGIELTDRSRLLYGIDGAPWDLAANALFAMRAAVSAGDEGRAVEAADEARSTLATVADPWLHVRFEALLGELARLRHRFTEAVDHLARAAATSHRLGFLQTEAYQVASLGRAHCQAGDYEQGAAALASAVTKAEAIGDVRMAALARVHLGRVLRALGETDRARSVLEQAARWHREVGGGEQAVLGESLLAAIDAGDGRLTSTDAAIRLGAALTDAAAADNAPAQVFALDALARLAMLEGDDDRSRSLSERADEQMREASHFIAERDRVDADAVRRRS